MYVSDHFLIRDNCHTPRASSQPGSRSHPRHQQCLCMARPACEAVQWLGGKAYIPASGTRLTTPRPLPETSAPTLHQARSLFSRPCSLRLTHGALLAWDPRSPSCSPTQPTAPRLGTDPVSREAPWISAGFLCPAPRELGQLSLS